MAVKDVMEALRDTVVNNSRLSELVKDIKLIGRTLEIVYRLPQKGLEEDIVEKTRNRRTEKIQTDFGCFV
ncbi:MAG: hypothetical protein ACK42C_05080 [Aquificaceae bacterium]